MEEGAFIFGKCKWWHHRGSAGRAAGNGGNFFEGEGQYKAIITDGTITIKKKGVNAFAVKSFIEQLEHPTQKSHSKYQMMRDDC